MDTTVAMWILAPFAFLGAATAAYWIGEFARFLVAARLSPWLRSRRKRPGPRPQEPLMGTLLPPMERPPMALPEGIEEEAELAEVNYKLGYAAGWNAALKPSSPPSSKATALWMETHDGSGGSSTS